MTADAYLISLTEVDTSRMPRGTLFVAAGLIYEVVEAGTAFARARQWRRDEQTDVALIPGSFLTRTLPLVAKGRLLPVYRSRTELTDNGQPRGFIFPTEKLAKDAAYLDVALIMSAGAYVRNHHQDPGFAVTDGVQIFRLYYYMRSDHGRDTHLTSNVVENPHCELHPHADGPMYWRLLPSWQEAFPPGKQTQLAMPAVNSPVVPDHAQVTQEMKAVRLPEFDPGEVTQPSRAAFRDYLAKANLDPDETSPNHPAAP